MDPDATQVADIRLGLAWVDREVRDRLGADVGIVATQPPDPASWHLEIRDVGDYRELTDEYGMVWRQPMDGGLYFDLHAQPAGRGHHAQDVAAIPGRTQPTPIGSPSCAPTASAWCSRRNGRPPARASSRAPWRPRSGCAASSSFFMDLVLDPTLAGAILDKVLEVKLRYWEQVLRPTSATSSTWSTTRTTTAARRRR